MVPRLVPEISSPDAFCDGAAAGAGIGDSRSWISSFPKAFLAPSFYTFAWKLYSH